MSTVHIENMGLSPVRATAGDRMNALGLCITGPWGAALGRAGPISYRQQHLEVSPVPPPSSTVELVLVAGVW